MTETAPLFSQGNDNGNGGTFDAEVRIDGIDEARPIHGSQWSRMIHFLRNVTDGKELGTFVAVANFSNAIIGSGALALPLALGEGGLVLGIGLLVIVAFISNYTLRSLFTLMVNFKQKTFHDLAGKAYTRRGRDFVLGIEIIFSISAMLTYWIIIQDLLERLIPGVEIHWLLFVASVPVLFLFYSKKFSQLWPFSLVSLFFVGFFTIFVVGRWIQGPTSDEYEIRSIRLGSRFPSAVGPITFAFVCHHQASLVNDGSFPYPTKPRLHYVASVSLFIAFIFSATVSVFGYMIFTDSKGDFMQNFVHEHGRLIDFGRISVLANLAFTLPSEQMVARNAIIKIIELKRKDKEEKSAPLTEKSKEGFVDRIERRYNDKYSPKRLRIERYIVSTTLWLFPVAIALIVNDVTHVLELTGGIAGSFLAFIGPALLNYRLGDTPEDEQRWNSWPNIFNICIVIFGIVALVGSSTATLLAISRGE